MTVGEGTAGGGIHHGLEHAIRSVGPDAVALMPSSSGDSQALAELLVESFPGMCFLRPGGEGEGFFTFDDPEDLLGCRGRVAQAADAARARLGPLTKLLLNPISGTKQMSIGAVLGAIECSIPTLCFTVGDRSEGIVVEGSERNQVFPLQELYEERVAAQAELLSGTGNFEAATALTGLHLPALAPVHRDLQIKGAWSAYAYRQAQLLAREAGDRTFGSWARSPLKTLAGAPPESLPRGVDIFNNAGRLLRWKHSTACVVHLYNGAELLARHRLSALGVRVHTHSRKAGESKPERYQVDGSLRTEYPELSARIDRCNQSDGIWLGFRDLFTLLRALNDPAAGEWEARPELQELLQKRNRTVSGHGTEAIGANEARIARRLFREWLCASFSGARELIRCLSWPGAGPPEAD